MILILCSGRMGASPAVYKIYGQWHAIDDSLNTQVEHVCISKRSIQAWSASDAIGNRKRRVLACCRHQYLVPAEPRAGMIHPDRTSGT